TKLAEPARLHSGDIISVGKTTLVFDESEDGGVALAPSEQAAPEISAETAERATMVSSAASFAEAGKAATAAPAAAGGPKYVLKVVEGANPGKIYELGSEALTLGRHPSNTIQIDDEAASNYHAEVT